MNPKISIIVPIYNVENYLRKCVDSILSQTFKDFELILVDDGSPDNCGIICDNYAESDQRIKVVHKENEGVSSARNTGIRMAKGKYIGFIDSDDYIDNRMYEILYTSAELHSSDVVVCDLLKVHGDEVSVKKYKKEFSLLHYSNIEALNQLYTNEPEKAAVWVYSWNKLYKSWLFKDIRFSAGKIYEDEFIAHKILYHSTKITYVPETLYYYFQRTNSYIGSEFSTKKFDRVYALKERADFFKKINQISLHDLAMRNFMEVFFWYYSKAQSDLNNVNTEIKVLKRTLNRSVVSLMKNPLIGWKQKVFILLFVIYPFVYRFKWIKGKKLKST
ncbi:glycosyltransferase family 2 protein [Neobacillus vireti]|uniref:Glycosyl transferase family protein n=1 Tax=Neobacillus vireti LMG 21834 TaxID=1131730 RepID=A0AB94IKI5_9BACI|nr:glycosyltransferase [Neobacillus vireti]ETI67555.1 glycosyl transferase family protein [Neobacillus vireti LMG 21834]KLT18494.1 hypothetical protein AA980_09290 [Neobacillus vireti]